MFTNITTGLTDSSSEGEHMTRNIPILKASFRISKEILPLSLEESVVFGVFEVRVILR